MLPRLRLLPADLQRARFSRSLLPVDLQRACFRRSLLPIDLQRARISRSRPLPTDLQRVLSQGVQRNKHRAAASISTVSLHLDAADDDVALTAIGDRRPAALAATLPAELTIEQRVLEQLEAAAAPMTATALRRLCQVRNSTLQAALAALVTNGRLRKDRAGYALAR
jgi:hypothetical protein